MGIFNTFGLDLIDKFEKIFERIDAISINFRLFVILMIVALFPWAGLNVGIPAVLSGYVGNVVKPLILNVLIIGGLYLGVSVMCKKGYLDASRMQAATSFLFVYLLLYILSLILYVPFALIFYPTIVLVSFGFAPAFLVDLFNLREGFASDLHYSPFIHSPTLFITMGLLASVFILGYVFSKHRLRVLLSALLVLDILGFWGMMSFQVL